MKLALTAPEAATILKANAKNIDTASKRILQKVVDKRPLSEDEIGELEGIVAGAELESAAAKGLLEPGEGGEVLSTTEQIDGKTFPDNNSQERMIEIQDRRRQVLAMRLQHPPVPIRKIAKYFGVANDTICRDLKNLKKEHGRILNGETTLEMLGQTVAQYDLLHGKALQLVDSFSSPMAKAALLRTAISALDSKSRLMGETGVIHRVPERQEILVAHADAGTVRDRVAKLMRAMDERSSPTLVLPEAKPEPPLIDPDLETADAKTE